MKKNYMLLLLLVMLLALSGTGEAFERGFTTGWLLGGDDGPWEEASSGEIVEQGQPELQERGFEVSDGSVGWEVVTSHTFEIREWKLFYNSGLGQEESHEVGFDLEVTLEDGGYFLVATDDAPVPSGSVEHHIFMGYGAVPNWEIKNIIRPAGLDYVPSEYIGTGTARVKYKHHIYVSVEVEVSFYENEIMKVGLITRDEAGNEADERNLHLHEILGKDPFIHDIRVDFECYGDEDDPGKSVPRAGQESRIFFRWVTAHGYGHTVTWYMANGLWERSNVEGETLFTGRGNGATFELSPIRVPAPALFARIIPQHGDYHPFFKDKYFTYDDLGNFEGSIKVNVVTPDGDPLPDMRVQFWGGANLGHLSEKTTDKNGELEINYPPGTDGTDSVSLEMTVFPLMDLYWYLTQVVDNPSRIVVDHKAPLFVSPYVFVKQKYPSDKKLQGVGIEVYDSKNPDVVINQSPPSGYRRYANDTYAGVGNYTNNEVVIQGKHRAYIQINPADLLPPKRLAVRAVMKDTDRGRRESRVILGTCEDRGSGSSGNEYVPHELYKARKEFNFIFVPLQVGAWESSAISYPASTIMRQEEFIRKVFPAPISFSKALPFHVARANGWLWGKESHDSYLRRIFRTLNRIQKSGHAGGADLVVGLTPPGFLGASGLQQAGTFGLNWEFLGAAHGAVLLDPGEALAHHTLHEFLHTLGLKDVYPKNEVPPLSANGHDGKGPINNLLRDGKYITPFCEAIMYDHTHFPWPTGQEYTKLLEYATQPVTGTGAELLLAEEDTDVLLLSGEVVGAIDKIESVFLDPVLPYRGAVDRGVDMGSNSYMLQLVDSQGEVLDHGFFETFKYEGRTFAPFQLSFPRRDDIAAIEIGHLVTHPTEGEMMHVWKRYEFSESAPQVTITAPTGGGTLSGEFQISWRATHEAGAPLSSTLMASGDGGQNWRLIAMDIAHEGPGNFSRTVNANELPAGEEYKFKVVVSDGLRFAEKITAETYKVEGYRTSPALEMPDDITVSVTEGMHDASAVIPMRNIGSEKLVVEFDTEAGVPDWVSPDSGEIAIWPGEKHVEIVPLDLPTEAPEGPLVCNLNVKTNDPEKTSAVVRLTVDFVEEAAAPGLASCLTDPSGLLDGGDWPVDTPFVIVAYADGARRGLDAVVSVESIPDGEMVAEAIPMEPYPHIPGSYILSWNPAENDIEAGDYGVRIHLSDPVTELEREVDGYDFSFSLYVPNCVPSFQEPEKYESDWKVKRGETISIPFRVADPDGDLLDFTLDSPLCEHGLELVMDEGGNNSGNIVWTANQEGEFDIYLTAKDPYNAWAEAKFRLVVNPPNKVRLEIFIWKGDSGGMYGDEVGTVELGWPSPMVDAHVSIPVKAVPAAGYEFVRWSLAPDENITIDDINAAETTVKLTGDAVLRAIFTEIQGSQLLGDLEIGDRVVDPSWVWEHRMGSSYSNKDRAGNTVPAGVKKAVTWIVAAKDHYDVEGDRPHVTLVSEELIARHPFDDSTNRGIKWEFGSNNWGDSGKPNADHGLRPFLNSLDKKDYAYAGDGFYDAFSQMFRSGVLTTKLPNTTWDTGSTYFTDDRVFALSLAEMGLAGNRPAGTVLPYFDLPSLSYAHAERLKAYLPRFQGSGLGGMDYEWYWTRQADECSEYYMCVVGVSGNNYGTQAPTSSFGVRPALNLSSNMKVTLVPNNKGAYEIVEGVLQSIIYGNPSGDGTVTVKDAIFVLRDIVGLANLTPEQIIAADVNGDGKVDVQDAILILRRIVGLIDKFPVEEA